MPIHEDDLTIEARSELDDYDRRRGLDEARRRRLAKWYEQVRDFSYTHGILVGCVLLIGSVLLTRR